MKKLLLSLGVGLLLSGGCVFFQNRYVEPQAYDLPPAKPLRLEGGGIQLGVIRNFSGADRRILVRQEDGTVRRDEYRRWTLDPELLIRRFFYETLQGSAPSPSILISGSLYRFEYVLNPAEARFLAGFVLTGPGGKRELRCDYTVAINEKTSPVAAMSECLTRAAAEIRKNASEMLRSGAKK